MTIGPGPLYNLLPDRDPTPPELSADFHWEPPDGYTGPECDSDGILVIADSPHGVCPDCFGALELHEAELYCPDCTAFGLASAE